MFMNRSLTQWAGDRLTEVIKNGLWNEGLIYTIPVACLLHTSLMTMIWSSNDYKPLSYTLTHWYTWYMNLIYQSVDCWLSPFASECIEKEKLSRQHTVLFPSSPGPLSAVYFFTVNRHCAQYDLWDYAVLFFPARCILLWLAMRENPERYSKRKHGIHQKVSPWQPGWMEIPLGPQPPLQRGLAQCFAKHLKLPKKRHVSIS